MEWWAIISSTVTAEFSDITDRRMRRGSAAAC